MKIVILAGGKGTRFWPRSTEARPKQFLPLTSDETMIQLTYRRFLQRLPATKVYIVTTKQYLGLLREQLPELPERQIIVEPEQRDTGPCIALSAMRFLMSGDDEVLVTMPSDHYISGGEPFWNALLKAEQAALAFRTIVTLGIRPTRPETGYGYIETEEPTADGSVHGVKAFIEKPDEAKARQLVQNPRVYWNSGIFIWKPSTIAHYMIKLQNRMWTMIKDNFDNIDAVYPQIPRISVDYAILEKADTLFSIPVQFEWDDIGSWTSMERIHAADGNGNILKGDVYSSLAENSIVYSEHQRAVIIGVKDLIVVSTDEGLLVCHKSKEQHIKDVLKSFSSG